jgi:hypothetical protein
MGTLTDTLDPTRPDGDESPTDGDDVIRKALRSLMEMLGEDHYTVKNGDVYESDENLEHKKITLREQAADPTNASNKGFLYTKETDSKTTFHVMDEDGNVLRLTKLGRFCLDQAQLSNNTALKAWNQANTTDVEIAMVNTSDSVVMPNQVTMNSGFKLGANSDANSKKIENLATGTTDGDAVNMGQFTNVSALGNNLTDQTLNLPYGLKLRIIEATIDSNVISDTTNVAHGLTRCFCAVHQMITIVGNEGFDTYVIKQDSINSTNIVFRNTNAFDVKLKIFALGR